MPTFTIPIHESNDCHEPSGSPDGGQFCGKKTNPPGKGERPRPGRVPGGFGYKITFRSHDPVTGRDLGRYYYLHSGVRDALEPGDERKIQSARVRLRFTGMTMGHTHAPVRWKAPNGVTVVYLRGQRRNEATGVGLYHDFNVEGDEQVVPLTRNIGSGRRALRAWADAWMVDRTTQRMRLRQLVRPGD